MPQKAPIVSLHFKRPDHSRQALQSLAKNDGAAESELFIFCDGARNEQEAIQVEQVRQVVRSQQWCGQVHIIEREKNLGCFGNSVSAITQICRDYGRVIFIEDDSVLSPQFLNYMNDALVRYQDQSQVMHISGYLWPLQAELPETFLLKHPNVWTFATWQRAWGQYKPDAEILLDQIRSAGLEEEFSFNGTRPYMNLLEEAATRSIHSWSIYWAAIVFLNGLSLYPNHSLVKNIGFDGTGIHYTSSTSIYNTKVSEARIREFTNAIEEDAIAKQKFLEFFQSIQPRRGSLWERGTHKLQKSLKDLARSIAR